MNFREIVDFIKRIKEEPEDLSIEGRIQNDAIIPYIEKKVSAEQLEKGFKLSVYHCDRNLLIVAGTDIVHQEACMDASDTSKILKALKTKFERDGYEITDSNLYGYRVIIKSPVYED